MSYHLKITH